MKSGIVESNNPRLLPKRSAYPACPCQFLLSIITYILSPWYTPLTRWCFKDFWNLADNQSYSMIDKLELSYFTRPLTFRCKGTPHSSHLYDSPWQTRTADQFGVNEPLYHWAKGPCVVVFILATSLLYHSSHHKERKIIKALNFLCTDYKSAAFQAQLIAVRAFRIGLTRLELVTPRLSSVCSNHWATIPL